PGRALRPASGTGSRREPGPPDYARVATCLQPKSDCPGTGGYARVPVTPSEPLEKHQRERSGGSEGRKEGRKDQTRHEARAGPASSHGSLPGVAERERVSLCGLEMKRFVPPSAAG